MTSPWSAPDDANPFAPPSEDVLTGPVVAGSAHGVPGVYGQPLPAGAYGPPPVWPSLPGNDPLAIAALVCGIAGLVILPVPFSQIGLGLGIASLLRIRNGLLRGKGMAVAGVVLGAVGTVAILGLGAMFGVMLWAGTSGF